MSRRSLNSKNDCWQRTIQSRSRPLLCRLFTSSTRPCPSIRARVCTFTGSKSKDRSLTTGQRKAIVVCLVVSIQRLARWPMPRSCCAICCHGLFVVPWPKGKRGPLSSWWRRRSNPGSRSKRRFGLASKQSWHLPSFSIFAKKPDRSTRLHWRHVFPTFSGAQFRTSSCLTRLAAANCLSQVCFERKWNACCSIPKPKRLRKILLASG